MPATDTTPMEAFDLRTISSDYRLNCGVHGQVNMALRFNGDWNRLYCQDCFEVEVAKLSRKVTLDTGAGPPITAQGK